MDLRVFDNFTIHILSKNKLKLYSLCTKKKKNMTNAHIDEILSNPSIVMSIIKVEFFFNIQKEHFHPIIHFNGIGKNNWVFYEKNLLYLLKPCPNLIYFVKTFQFIVMFPNIIIKKSQIMNHKNLYMLKSNRNFSQMKKFNHHTLN